jgi:hypothetical protein
MTTYPIFSLYCNLRPVAFLKEVYMLHIEYIHKRARLFRVELSLRVLAVLLVLFLIWQILSVLHFFK